MAGIISSINSITFDSIRIPSEPIGLIDPSLIIYTVNGSFIKIWIYVGLEDVSVRNKKENIRIGIDSIRNSDPI